VPPGDDIGFLLAQASRRWNEVLERRFAALGYPEVRASYGALLVPLFDEDGLRLSELARRSRISKQTMTTMARLLERDGLVQLRADEDDARATRVVLTRRGRAFESVARDVLRELHEQVGLRLTRKGRTELRDALLSLVELDAPEGSAGPPSG
jgi:DNA-binding MarR family transcriptional regulator